MCIDVRSSASSAPARTGDKAKKTAIRGSPSFRTARHLMLPRPDRTQHKADRRCHEHAVDRLLDHGFTHVIKRFAVVALDRAERLAGLALGLRRRVAGEASYSILH